MALRKLTQKLMVGF